jgi:hypothetical protein
VAGAQEALELGGICRRVVEQDLRHLLGRPAVFVTNSTWSAWSSWAIGSTASSSWLRSSAPASSATTRSKASRRGT